MTVSLARAFTIRSRTMKEISEVGKDISLNNLKVSSDSDFSLNDTIEKILCLRDKLAKINSVIDEANVRSGARDILNQIEITKKNIGLFSCLAETKKGFSTETKEFDSHEFNPSTNTLGAYVVKHWKLSFDEKYVAKLDEMKKRLNELEDKLSEINASTTVELPS